MLLFCVSICLKSSKADKQYSRSLLLELLIITVYSTFLAGSKGEGVHSGVPPSAASLPSLTVNELSLPRKFEATLQS